VINLSDRLLSITQFLEFNDKVVDVGCDHGLLSIYIKMNNIVSKIIASDINANALNNAKQNIKKYNLDISTILSDGLNNINTNDLNTLIISGMGTITIKHILSNNKEKLEHINKIIIQSNTEHEELRKFMNSINYYLEDEIYIYDKNKWYITSKFIKDNRKNTDTEIKYGYLNNKEYNDYLIMKINSILSHIPKSNSDYIKLKNNLEEIKKITNN